MQTKTSLKLQSNYIWSNKIMFKYGKLQRKRDKVIIARLECLVPRSGKSFEAMSEHTKDLLDPILEKCSQTKKIQTMEKIPGPPRLTQTCPSFH